MVDVLGMDSEEEGKETGGVWGVLKKEVEENVSERVEGVGLADCADVYCGILGGL
jgi:hypothetical protein